MIDSYTVAIVGCGTIGRSHAKGCQLTDKAELVAAVDPVEAARIRFSKEFNVARTFATTGELYTELVPDIVIVCTWHHGHPDDTIAAAKAGAKAVICEKPMAIGLAAADFMIEGCRSGDTKLIIGHQRRFTVGWEKTRALIREGAIGQPLMVECCVASGLINWGSHVIDGARFVLGEPAAEWVMGAVQRTSNRYERNVPIEDCCVGLVQMESGLQLFIQSDLKMQDASAGGFLVRGTDGVVETSEWRVRLLHAEAKGWQEFVLEKPSDGMGGKENADQISELITWLEGGPEHRCSAETARSTLEIMMSLYESARRHQVIRLPLEEGAYPVEKMISEFPRVAERYDIRSYLDWKDVDLEEYDRRRAAGMDHHSAMHKLNVSPREST